MLVITSPHCSTLALLCTALPSFLCPAQRCLTFSPFLSFLLFHSALSILRVFPALPFFHCFSLQNNSISSILCVLLFSLLRCSASGHFDINTYISLLKPYGRLVNVGVPPASGAPDTELCNIVRPLIFQASNNKTQPTHMLPPGTDPASPLFALLPVRFTSWASLVKQAH